MATADEARAAGDLDGAAATVEAVEAALVALAREAELVAGHAAAALALLTER